MGGMYATWFCEGVVGGSIIHHNIFFFLSSACWMEISLAAPYLNLSLAIPYHIK